MDYLSLAVQKYRTFEFQDYLPHIAYTAIFGVLPSAEISGMQRDFTAYFARHGLTATNPSISSENGCTALRFEFQQGLCNDVRVQAEELDTRLFAAKSDAGRALTDLLLPRLPPTSQTIASQA